MTPSKCYKCGEKEGDKWFSLGDKMYMVCTGCVREWLKPEEKKEECGDARGKGNPDLEPCPCWGHHNSTFGNVIRLFCSKCLMRFDDRLPPKKKDDSLPPA